MILRQAIHESLARHGDKVICRDADSRFTAQQLLTSSRAAAGQLTALNNERPKGPMLRRCLPPGPMRDAACV